MFLSGICNRTNFCHFSCLWAKASTMDLDLLNLACVNINTVIDKVFDYSLTGENGQKALVVYDDGCPLSRLLAQAYRQILPRATVIDFDQSDAEKIKDELHKLSPQDLVVLIQSMSFRLDAFRIRIHLFERGLKVIEHPHLSRVQDNEIATYVASLNYDANYYRQLGPELKKRLDQARKVKLLNADLALTYAGHFETAKLNIGDYTGMKNWGGQFPIGEVFTELRDLECLSGKIALFAFGDNDFSITNCEPPLVLDIQRGRVVASHPVNPLFEEILEKIRQHEGAVWVRELGFGLNRAITRTIQIHDVGIYERMCGVHLSLGAKHALYPKVGFDKKKVKFHVDVFAVIDSVTIDDETVYEEDAYVI